MARFGFTLPFESRENWLPELATFLREQHGLHIVTTPDAAVLDAMAALHSPHLRDWIQDAGLNYPITPDGLIRNVRIRSTVTAFKAELARRGETNG